MTRYCAKAEPEVICDGLFLLCPLCLYIKVFSTFALEKLLRWSGANVLNILDGAVSFCENDAGELLVYIELVL